MKPHTWVINLHGEKRRRVCQNKNDPPASLYISSVILSSEALLSVIPRITTLPDVSLFWQFSQGSTHLLHKYMSLAIQTLSIAFIVWPHSPMYGIKSRFHGFWIWKSKFHNHIIMEYTFPPGLFPFLNHVFNMLSLYFWAVIPCVSLNFFVIFPL